MSKILSRLTKRYPNKVLVFTGENGVEKYVRAIGLENYTWKPSNDIRGIGLYLPADCSYEVYDDTLMYLDEYIQASTGNYIDITKEIDSPIELIELFTTPNSLVMEVSEEYTKRPDKRKSDGLLLKDRIEKMFNYREVIFLNNPEIPYRCTEEIALDMWLSDYIWGSPEEYNVPHLYVPFSMTLKQHNELVEKAEEALNRPTWEDITRDVDSPVTLHFGFFTEDYVAVIVSGDYNPEEL